MLARLKQTVKHTAIYAAGNMGSKLIGIVLLPIYTKSIPVGMYGILGVLEVVDVLANHILAVGLPQAFLRWHSMADGEKKKKSYVFTVSIALLATGVVSLALVVLLRTPISILVFEDAAYAELFVYLFVAIVFSVLNKIPLTLLRIEEKSLYYSVVIVCQFTTSLLLNIYFIAFLGMGVKGILLAQLISAAIVFAALLPYLLRKLHPSFEFDELKAMLRFGGPFVFGLIATSILNMGDRYLLVKLSSEAQAGIYTLGFKFSGIVKVFLVDAFALGLPIVGWQIVKSDNQPERFFCKTMTYFVLVATWLGLFVVAYSKGLIHRLALNPDYWPSANVVPVLTLSVVFSGIQRVFFFVLQIPKKTKYIAVVVGSAAVFNIVMNIFLIPIFGIMGAACATLGTQIGATITFYFVVQRFYPGKYEIKRILTLLAVTVLLYLATLAVDGLSFPQRITAKTGIILAYPAILRAIGFFEPIELDRINGSIRKWTAKAMAIIGR